VVAKSREFGFINWIRSRQRPHDQLRIGIGDDTALLALPNSQDALITVDMLLEGVHFTCPPTLPRHVGRKALAVNLSDIAAMAGRPLAAVVSVSLPQGQPPAFAEELVVGLQDLADEFGVALAGGDTNSWVGPLVISVTVVGEPVGAGAVTRSGARVGDWIMATGTYGGSLAGSHYSFQPRVREALLLHERVRLHAMIDVSDGLAADLHHILEESQVGAILDANAIPISEAAIQMDDDRSPLEHALGDGEDFELLLTVDPSEGQGLLDAPPFDTKLSHIGEITSGTECKIRDSRGDLRNLDAHGWTHDF
jgi:thiamine-monophosphate kinase